MDKLALKVSKSLGREKKVKERKKGWEDVNELKKKKKSGKEGGMFDALGEEEERKEREWVSDEEMDGADKDGVVDGGEVKADGVELEVAVPTSVPALAEGEDEML